MDDVSDMRPSEAHGKPTVLLARQYEVTVEVSGDGSLILRQEGQHGDESDVIVIAAGNIEAFIVMTIELALFRNAKALPVQKPPPAAARRADPTAAERMRRHRALRKAHANVGVTATVTDSVTN